MLAGNSVGDYCFGFHSVETPGSEQGRGARKAKPRKAYTIDPETAAWVSRIYQWFVTERRSLRWITRDLNRQGAPKDHRATTKQWRHQYLPRLLRNRKYVGVWPWGQMRNVRDPLSGKIHQEDRSPEEKEKWLRHFPDLRLIDDETFQAAQRLLKENDEACASSRGRNGRLTGSQPGTGGRCRHLLSQLIRCAECGRWFIVGGTQGKYLFCPGYAMGECSCKTQLLRERAERMILAEIGPKILADPVWRQSVVEEFDRAHQTTKARLPAEILALAKSLADVERKIGNLLDQAENGEAVPELSERLARRRAERRELAEQLERLRQADQQRQPVPTAAWVDEKLLSLGEVLRQPTPAACRALRDLVGGAIVVHEVHRPGHVRHVLQGQFTITTTSVAMRGITVSQFQPRARLAAMPSRTSKDSEIGHVVVVDNGELFPSAIHYPGSPATIGSVGDRRALSSGYHGHPRPWVFC